MKRPVFLTFLSVLLFSSAAFSLFADESEIPADIPLDVFEVNTTGTFPLNNQLRILVDSENLTYEAAADALLSGAFLPVGDGLLNLGFTKDTVWLGLGLENGGASGDWFLEFAFALLDVIELYRLQEDGIPVLIGRSGRKVPYTSRAVRHRHFFLPVELPRGEPVYFLMKIRSDDAMIIPLKLTTRTLMGERARPEYFLFGLFYGIAAAMLLYNLFLFLIIRDRSYLFYILYLVSFVLFQMDMNGIGTEFLWFNAVDWSIRSDPFFLFMALTFGTQFTISFLDMKKVSRTFFLLLKAVGIISALMAVLSLFIDVQVSVVAGQLLPLITVLLVIPAGVTAYRRGARYARYYFIGWSFLLLGVVFSTLRALGILPQHQITEHGIQLGGAMEMILLSLALADRISFLKSEKLRVEHEKLSVIQASESRAAVVAEIAEELKEPLNEVVDLTGQILGSEDPEEVRDNAQQILCESENLLELITSLHDYTRMETGRLELESVIFSLKDTLEGCLFGVRLLIEDRGIDFEISFDEDMPPLVEGDAYRFKQIMQTLVQNSYKNTESGRIELHIGFLRQHAGTASGVFSFQLKDSGRGLSAAEIGYILEPGEQERTHSFRMGEAEMGLKISRHLVDLMGGRFSIESQPGTGTVYSLVLPFTLPVQRKQTSQKPKYGGHLLVAAARKVDSLVVSRQLEALGFKVDTTSSREEMEFLGLTNPYDLILLEFGFLEEDRAIVHRMRSITGANRETAVAVITGGTPEEIKDHCGGWEPSAILEKPLRKTAIRELVEEIFSESDPS